eukprot:g12752.t1
MGAVAVGTKLYGAAQTLSTYKGIAMQTKLLVAQGKIKDEGCKMIATMMKQHAKNKAKTAAVNKSMEKLTISDDAKAVLITASLVTSKLKQNNKSKNKKGQKTKVDPAFIEKVKKKCNKIKKRGTAPTKKELKSLNSDLAKIKKMDFSREDSKKLPNFEKLKKYRTEIRSQIYDMNLNHYDLNLNKLEKELVDLKKEKNETNDDVRIKELEKQIKAREDAIKFIKEVVKIKDPEELKKYIKLRGEECTLKKMKIALVRDDDKKPHETVELSDTCIEYTKEINGKTYTLIHDEKIGDYYIRETGPPPKAYNPVDRNGKPDRNKKDKMFEKIKKPPNMKCDKNGICYNKKEIVIEIDGVKKTFPAKSLRFQKNTNGKITLYKFQMAHSNSHKEFQEWYKEIILGDPNIPDEVLLSDPNFIYLRDNFLDSLENLEASPSMRNQSIDKMQDKRILKKGINVFNINFNINKKKLKRNKTRSRKKSAGISNSTILKPLSPEKIRKRVSLQLKAVNAWLKKNDLNCDAEAKNILEIYKTYASNFKEHTKGRKRRHTI